MGVFPFAAVFLFLETLRRPRQLFLKEDALSGRLCFPNPISSRLDDHLVRHIRQHDGPVANAHPGTDFHADRRCHAHADQRPLANANR